MTLEATMHLSRYVQSKALPNGIVGLYSPFGHRFCYLSSEGWQQVENGQFERLDERTLETMQQQQFLVEEGFEARILNHYLPPTEHIREMWLVVEQACNMACQYCVTEGNVEEPAQRTLTAAKGDSDAGGCGSTGANTMREEIALAAVRKFAAYLEKTRPVFPRVTLYGGEPLLNWPVIEAVVPAIRNIRYPGQVRERPVQVLVITNGQICRDSMVEFFSRHQVSVSVSLDGLEHHHDSQRITLSGKGTFQRAAESLRRYKAAGLNVGICTTIGKHNYRDLPEIADYFADEFAVPVELQVPFDIPFNGGNQSSIAMVDAAPYAVEAYARMRRKGLLEGLLGRRMVQVNSGTFHHRDCSAVGGQIVVAPDGSIGPCHAFSGQRKFFAGNVLEDSDPWDNLAFHEWSRRQPVNMPDCHGCSAIAICGGGCPYNAHVATGSIWGKDPQQCAYMHYLIDWMIEDIWNQHAQEPCLPEEVLPQ